MQVKHTLKAGVHTFAIELTGKEKPSKSGKTTVLATTGGNVTVTLADGTTAKMGVTIYREGATA